MTDGVVDKCNIRTGTFVIHYDTATSKKLFGKRLSCMSSSYPSTDNKQCFSLTLGTENSLGCACVMKELVLRSGGHVPPTLDQICEFANEVCDCKKADLNRESFCRNFCRLNLIWKDRHFTK